MIAQTQAHGEANMGEQTITMSIWDGYGRRECKCSKCTAQGHSAYREYYDPATHPGAKGHTVWYFIHGEEHGVRPGGPSASEWIVPGTYRLDRNGMAI